MRHTRFGVMLCTDEFDRVELYYMDKQTLDCSLCESTSFGRFLHQEQGFEIWNCFGERGASLALEALTILAN